MSDLSWLSRTALIIGEEKIKDLTTKNVLIVGLGGIGSYAAEGIARAGIGNLTIVDGDTVEASNRNRQLVALSSTEGKHKAEIMADRIRDINPDVNLDIINDFLEPESIEKLLLSKKFDYVVECIDSITPKVELLKLCRKNKVKVVCCGGAGGKIDPTKVQVTDIKKVYNDHMIRVVKKKLKKVKVNKGIKVVFSTEAVDKNSLVLTDGSNYKKSAYGTMSYLPAIFGLTAASVVIRALTTDK